MTYIYGLLSISNTEDIALLTSGQSASQSLLWGFQLASSLAPIPYTRTALWNLVYLVVYIAAEIQIKLNLEI